MDQNGKQIAIVRLGARLPKYFFHHLVRLKFNLKFIGTRNID